MKNLEKKFEKTRETDPKRLCDEIKRLKKRIKELEQENCILKNLNSKISYENYKRTI